MVADVLGYIISDKQILSTLTGKQRNVLQKFVDRITSRFGSHGLKNYINQYNERDRGAIKSLFKDVNKEADAIAEQFKAGLGVMSDTEKVFDKSTSVGEAVKAENPKKQNTSNEAKTEAEKRRQELLEIFSVDEETKNTATDDGVRYSKDISEALGKIADSFHIRNINDAIHVQRMVFDTLSSEGFFTSGENSRIVKNENTKSVIEINKSGIQETFGRLGNFADLGKRLKYLKLATIRDIPNLLEKAVLVEKNVKNKHKENSSVLFDYYRTETIVDGNPITVEFDIKKSPQKNKFWVHRIDVKENAEVNSSGADALKRRPNPDVDSSISKDNANVNRYSKELFSDDRIMSDYDIKTELGIIPNGELVYAFDRDNIGKIVGYRDEEGGLYNVHFVAPTGEQATVTLHADEIKPLDQMYLEKMPHQFDDENYQQISEENRSVETLEEVREIERLVQRIKSSDDLSYADVQAIRDELIQSAKQKRQELMNEILNTSLKRWGADVGRSDNVPKMSVEQAVKKVQDSFGIKITSGGDASR